MTVRTPVLRPRAAAGRGVPDARSCRVRVDAGALVLDRPGRATQVLAAAGTVTSVEHLEPAQTAAALGRQGSAAGGLVVRVAGGPVLALRLLDWSPPTDAAVDVLRATTGMEALAAGLGLPLEPGTASDVAALRAVEVRPLPSRSAPGRLSPYLAVSAAVLGFLAWPTGGSAPSAVLTALALALVAPVVVGVVRGRATARAGDAQAAPAGGLVVRPRPTGPVPAACLDHLLELRPDELLLRRRGTAGWLAGPASGGIEQAVLEPEHVRLTDAEGRDHAVLETALWCGDGQARAELADDLRAGGLRVLDSPLDSVLRHDRGDLSSAGVAPSLLQSDLERGDPSSASPYLAGLAVVLACGGSLGAVAWQPPVGIVLLAVGLALLVVMVTAGWRRRRDDRAAVRRVQAPTRPRVEAP